ncbi:hypothetical protein M2139_001642 [Enterococcus sp. PF1-24]|uniref:hypothetical protein n=1 Tax=unclassified Enterococcus TaxID=2608891 RepID=UPI002474F734|nr:MULTISPECIES: hypothetical protein [unclassified Enterococcus]MDH6364655.1 hypothetical protein [Enterococcus sp. PFB1-1]MDH6401756.1 hypothetical protein [Enterococcus sp. PF1-24]
MEIIEIFWWNVDWHRKNKELTWQELAEENYTADISLSEVAAIAKILEIDDYAILFEEEY